jgi:hypothetical protein
MKMWLQIIPALIQAFLVNARTLPGAVSTGSAIVAGAALSASGGVSTTDIIVIVCGAVGAAAQFVQSYLSGRGKND